MWKSTWCSALLTIVPILVASGCTKVPNSPETTSIVLQAALNGGVVNNPELARKIAELIVENAYGSEELKLQTPLRVTEMDDCWYIIGSRNINNDKDTSGNIVVVINKRDGKILDLLLDATK